MAERLAAPVQGDHGPGSVSRELAEMAYREYGRRYDQSLDRLLERGGFSWAELVFFLYAELVHQRDGRPASRELRFDEHVRVHR